MGLVDYRCDGEPLPDGRHGCNTGRADGLRVQPGASQLLGAGRSAALGMETGKASSDHRHEEEEAFAGGAHSLLGTTVRR